MPRAPRIQIHNALYYITSRGDNNEDIFKEGSDYVVYADLLKKCKERYKFKLFAFCFLPNHAHLLVETEGDTTISQIMHGLTSNYTKYFNGKYNRKGHLFQERYRMVVVEKEPNLLNITAYIHLNPRSANIAPRIDDYPYSSYPAYLNYITGSSRDSSAQIDLGAEIKEVLNYLKDKRYQDFITAMPKDLLSALGNDLDKKSVVGSEEFIEKAKSKVESEKHKQEELRLPDAAHPRISKIFIIAGSLIILSLVILASYLYVRGLAMKENYREELAQKESEFDARRSQEKKIMRQDFEKKYRATQIFYEVAPTGRDEWKAGAVKNIQWVASSLVSDSVKIGLYAKSDESGPPVLIRVWDAPSVKGLNTYPIEVPDNVGDNKFFIKIIDNNRTVYNPKSGERPQALFSIKEPAITLNEITADPGNKAVWVVGDTGNNITWVSEGKVSDNLYLYYTTDPSLAAWLPINKTGAQNNGTCYWDVPASAVSDHLRIKIVDGDRPQVESIMKNEFRIIECPTIKILHPAAEDKWVAGTTHTISWTTNGGESGAIHKLKIECLADSAKYDIGTIMRSDPNQAVMLDSDRGSIDWQVPADAPVSSATNKAKIKIYDPDRPNTVSSQEFSIEGPIAI